MKKAFLVLPSVLMSANSFGMGPKPPQELDYSAFQGRFQLTSSDKKCQYLTEFEFVTDAANHRVTMKYLTGENWVGQFDHINQGRVPFNSCFSDGFMGYKETAGSGTKIVDNLIVLNPGFMCSGGSVKRSETTTVELKGDTVTLDIEDTRYENYDFHCVFKRK
ncbi:MAG: hypothetical protein ACJ763_12100 [Bdellovibrionia bacterium]